MIKEQRSEHSLIKLFKISVNRESGTFAAHEGPQVVRKAHLRTRLTFNRCIFELWAFHQSRRDIDTPRSGK